jgi:predicted nucleotidyltransferase
MSAERDRVIERLRASRSDLQARGIRRLSLFGSLARGDGRTDSVVDVAVEIEPGRSFSLIRMEETRLMLEARLGRRVDLGEIEAFRPIVRAAFERDRVDVF